MTLKLKFCPTCGSEKIHKVQRNLTETMNGQTYTIPKLEFYECPNCGEQVYDREAMKKIQAASPWLAKRRKSRKVA